VKWRRKGSRDFPFLSSFFAKLGTRMVGSMLKLSMLGLLWTCVPGFLPGNGVMVWMRQTHERGHMV